MEKTIIVGGKEIKMKASALVPRLYRFKFGRDMLSDLSKLEKAFNKKQDLPKDATEEEIQEAELSALDLTIFENTAFVMAKLGDPEAVPETVDAWMDEFEIFSIYEALPQILELWKMSNQTTAVPKKN